jgi:hypothetical protein
MNKLLEKDEDLQSTRKVIKPRKMPLPRKCAQSKPSQVKEAPAIKDKQLDAPSWFRNQGSVPIQLSNQGYAPSRFSLQGSAPKSMSWLSK